MQGWAALDFQGRHRDHEHGVSRGLASTHAEDSTELCSEGSGMTGTMRLPGWDPVTPSSWDAHPPMPHPRRLDLPGVAQTPFR